MEFGKVGKAVLYSNNREMRRGGESPKLNQDQVVTPVSRGKEVSCSDTADSLVLPARDGGGQTKEVQAPRHLRWAGV